ncbi:iron-sulfur cluster assembly scaffold protein [Legionella sp. 16cNR16C]|uniref:iron-sulfur cluster assembly scaffold protein n=1 Tax=Legionella sp. 16cNR16C TaxID=2905656 RepID=UPI001E3724B6|nr:iron-sulfur cluster assembly scaffold protein [Legionella sp. 16cNR16C]MCE3046114.1 iron-sulfur cluster assembly scaffold protein [Legionella sp. 16cNR16C]
MIIYNELVERCFFKPCHAGILDCSEPYTVHVRAGYPGRSGHFDLYLQCDSGLIKKARFKAFGNPYLIAGLELLCEQVENSSLDGHPHFEHRELARRLDLPKNQQQLVFLIETGYLSAINHMKEKLGV